MPQSYCDAVCEYLSRGVGDVRVPGPAGLALAPLVPAQAAAAGEGG